MSSRAILASGQGPVSISTLSCALLSAQNIGASVTQAVSYFNVPDPETDDTKKVITDVTMLSSKIKEFVAADNKNRQFLLNVLAEVGRFVSIDNLEQNALLNACDSIQRAHLNQWVNLFSDLKTNARDIAAHCNMPDHVARLLAIRVINEFNKIMKQYTSNPNKIATMASVAKANKLLTKSRRERGTKDTNAELIEKLEESAIEELNNNLDGLREAINEDMEPSTEEAEKRLIMITTSSKQISKPDLDVVLNKFLNEFADIMQNHERPEESLKTFVDALKLSTRKIKALSQLALIRAFSESCSEKSLAALFTDFDAWLIPDVRANVMDYLHKRALKALPAPKDSSTASFASDMSGVEESHKGNLLNSWIEKCTSWEKQLTKTPLYAQDLILATPEELMELLELEVVTDLAGQERKLVVDAEKFKDLRTGVMNSDHTMVKSSRRGESRVPVSVAIRKLYFSCIHSNITLVLEGDFKPYISKPLIDRIMAKKVSMNWHERFEGRA